MFARVEELLVEISSLNFMRFVQFAYATGGCCLDSLIRAKRVLTLLGIPFSKLGTGKGRGTGAGTTFSSASDVTKGSNRYNLARGGSREEEQEQEQGGGHEKEGKPLGSSCSSTCAKGNFLDPRNLTPDGIKGLLSFAAVSEIKNLLVSWTRDRLGESSVMTGRKLQKGGRNFKVSGPFSGNNIWRADIPLNASSASLSETLLLFHRMDVSLVDLGERGSPSGPGLMKPHSLGPADVYRTLGILDRAQEDALKGNQLISLAARSASIYVPCNLDLPPPDAHASHAQLHRHYPCYESKGSQILSSKQEMLRAAVGGERKVEVDRGSELFSTMGGTSARVFHSKGISDNPNERNGDRHTNKYNEENNYNEVEAPTGSLSFLPKQIALEIRARHNGTTPSHRLSSPSCRTGYGPSESTAKNYPHLEKGARQSEIQNFMADWVKDPGSVREALRLSYLILELARYMVIARTMVAITNQSTGVNRHPLDEFQDELKTARDLEKEAKVAKGLQCAYFNTRTTERTTERMMKKVLQNDLTQESRREGLPFNMLRGEKGLASRKCRQGAGSGADATSHVTGLSRGLGVSRGVTARICLADALSSDDLYNFLHLGRNSSTRFAIVREGLVQGVALLLMAVGEVAAAECICRQSRGPRSSSYSPHQSQSTSYHDKKSDWNYQETLDPRSGATQSMLIPPTSGLCQINVADNEDCPWSDSRALHTPSTLPSSTTLGSRGLRSQRSTGSCVGSQRDDRKDKEECEDILKILTSLRVRDFLHFPSDVRTDVHSINSDNMAPTSSNDSSNKYRQQLDALCDRLFGPFSTYREATPTHSQIFSDREMGFERESSTQPERVDLDTSIPSLYGRGSSGSVEEVDSIAQIDKRSNSTLNPQLDVFEQIW